MFVNIIMKNLMKKELKLRILHHKLKKIIVIKYN